MPFKNVRSSGEAMVISHSMITRPPLLHFVTAFKMFAASSLPLPRGLTRHVQLRAGDLGKGFPKYLGKGLRVGRSSFLVATIPVRRDTASITRMKTLGTILNDERPIVGRFNDRVSSISSYIYYHCIFFCTMQYANRPSTSQTTHCPNPLSR